MEHQEDMTPSSTPTEETRPVPPVGATATATAQATSATATATAIARVGDGGSAVAQSEVGNDTPEEIGNTNLSEIISKAVLDALRRYDQEDQEIPVGQRDDDTGQNQTDPGTRRENNLLWLLKSALRGIFIREETVIGNRTVHTETTTVEVKRGLLAALLFLSQCLLFVFGATCVLVPFIGPHVESLKKLYSYNIDNAPFSILIGIFTMYFSRIVRILRVETQVMDGDQITDNLSIMIALLSAFAAFGSLLLSALSLLRGVLIQAPSA